MLWRRNRTLASNNGRPRYMNPTFNNNLPKPRRRRWIKAIIISLIILIIGSMGWVGYAGFRAIRNITSGSKDNSIWHFLKNPKGSQLSGERDGRINILLIGIGGKNHPGGTLADTVILLSIKPKEKKAAMVSIPRDLYVPIAGNGYGKINSAHSYGESKPGQTGGGATVLKKTVSDVFDVPIHYYIRADFAGFQKLVDSLGGVTIDVPKAINDPFYPDSKMIGYTTFRISKGTQTIDGATALKYARSRHSTSDFDRAKRQQQLLVAIKDKALSAGVLSNPKKLVDIFNILGDHIRTDLSIQELEHLVQLSKDFNSNNISQTVLDNGPDGPLVASTGSGGYYLKPKTGNYRELQRIVQQVFNTDSDKSKQATIEVRNATGQSGIASKVSKELTDYGYTATYSTTVQAAARETVLYDYTNGDKKFTTDFLTKKYDAQVVTKTSTTTAGSDYVLILGTSYLTSANQ